MKCIVFFLNMYAFMKLCSACFTIQWERNQMYVKSLKAKKEKIVSKQIRTTKKYKESNQLFHLNERNQRTSLFSSITKKSNAEKLSKFQNRNGNAQTHTTRTAKVTKRQYLMLFILFYGWRSIEIMRACNNVIVLFCSCLLISTCVLFKLCISTKRFVERICWNKKGSEIKTVIRQQHQQKHKKYNIKKISPKQWKNNENDLQRRNLIQGHTDDGIKTPHWLHKLYKNSSFLKNINVCIIEFIEYSFPPFAIRYIYRISFQ